MKKNMFLLVLGFFFVAVSNAFAVPALGVATDQYIYAYTDPAAPADYYIKYFTENKGGSIVEGDTYHGFVVGPSGSSLTIFTSYDPARWNIYLMSNMTNSTVSVPDEYRMSFSGVEMSTISYVQNHADVGEQLMLKSYSNDEQTYFKSLLLSTSTFHWDAMGDVFNDGQDYWFCTGMIDYSEAWVPGDYFFAARDFKLNDYGVLTEASNSISPITASAGGVPKKNPVPEPASMMLLGVGLLGLVSTYRKKRS